MLPAVVVFGVVAANVVVPAFVPPNTCIVLGTVKVGFDQTPIPGIVNFSGGAATVLPNTVITASSSATKTSPWTYQDYVYVNYQSRLRPVNGLLTELAKIQLGVEDLIDDFSMVHNFYGSSLMYFGGIPESIRAHMSELGTTTLVTAPTNGVAIPIQATDGTSVQTIHLSLGHWASNASALCGTWTLVGVPDLVVFDNVPCSGGGNASIPAVVSVYALGIGVHITTTNVTVYRPLNHEVNHVSAYFVILSLMLFLWAWFRWTRDIYTAIGDSAKRRRIWRKTTVQYTQFTCAALLMVLSRNMWAQAQSSHGLYNIETLDVMGLERLNIYTTLYADVFTVMVVLVNLLIVAYGNFRHAFRKDDGEDTMAPGWFSWNTTFWRHRPFGRFVVFVLVTAAIVSLTTLLWVYTVGSKQSAVLVATNVGIVMIYWSSSTRIHTKFTPFFQRLYKLDKALLIYLVASTKILVLTTVAVSTPYDVGGALAFHFHSFISMVTGIGVAVIVGRTLALIQQHGGFWGLLLFLPTAAFTVSFVMLFGLTSLYGTTDGALHGRPRVLLCCAACLAGAFVVLAFGNECIG